MSRSNRCAGSRPGFYLDDVHRADFFAVTAPTNTTASP